MVELTHDDMLKLLKVMDFQIVDNNEYAGHAGYMADTRSMLQGQRRLSFWVARKP